MTIIFDRVRCGQVGDAVNRPHASAKAASKFSRTHSFMDDRTIGRRTILKGMAALGMMAPTPLWAQAQPTAEEVGFDPDIPVMGNPDGDVTIVEYTDYQCPYCKVSYIELKKVMAVDRNIRLLLRDWPVFGQVSRNAALLALAADAQGRYALAVETLMLNRERLSFRRTADLLGAAGVDVSKARDVIATRQDAFIGLLARNETQAKAFGFPGTPGFLLGKAVYKRGMSADDFRKAIAHARA